MLDDKEIQRVVAQEVIWARGYDSDELAANRIGALNYYFGHPRGDEVEGRSQVQSLDVADHVNSTMAQLSPMLKASMIAFEPNGEDDEEAAQLESDVVLDIAGKSNAYLQFSNAAFDSLLQRNGWITCYVDDMVETWDEDHKDVDELAMQDLLTPVGPNDVVEVLRHKPNKAGTGTDIKVKHTVTTRELKIEAVPPEYMLYAPGHKSSDISDIRFVAQKKLQTKSELRESGLSKALVDSLPTISYDTWVQANARELATDDRVGGDEDSTYVVETYDAYIHIDVDQDGIAELWRVRVAGYDAAIFLDKERARFIPYCTGSARPLPHRTSGTSLYDALRFVQDSKTMTLRQLLDNQNVGNNVRIGAVEGEVNMADVLESKPGGIIRMRSPDALQPLAFNDVGPTCISTLNYMDTVATARAGAAKDLGMGEMQIASSSATAAAGEFGAKEKMSSFFARNIIESLVRGSYLLVHQALRSYYSEPITAKLAGKWITTDPRKWQPRRNMRVIAGLSSGERQEKAAALAQNLQYQTMAMQAGMDGTLVTPEGIHEGIADWLRVVDLDNVDSYYVDPTSEEAQQAGQQKQQAQQQEMQKQESLAQRLVDNEQQLDKYKHDTELQYKRWHDELQAQIEEMKITGGGMVDLEVESMKQAGKALETDDDG